MSRRRRRALPNEHDVVILLSSPLSRPLSPSCLSPTFHPHPNHPRLHHSSLVLAAIDIRLSVNQERPKTAGSNARWEEDASWFGLERDGRYGLACVRCPTRLLSAKTQASYRLHLSLCQRAAAPARLFQRTFHARREGVERGGIPSLEGSGVLVVACSLSSCPSSQNPG
ncbi:hypothetical protein SCHPADRAFT_730586 [Schizopora paradoxa]|uniref:Uncharacterized protein n=1 Tax=Schizopora paradoxa TaxID=27342 RepID=A0A0H2R1Y6_9AGAM|nr:hypothetical protein SCHPADRAFT_730586 [Schizopora paradoxa]